MHQEPGLKVASKKKIPLRRCMLSEPTVATSADMNWCCVPRANKREENPYSNSIGGKETKCIILFAYKFCTCNCMLQYAYCIISGIYSEKNIRLFSYAELRSATDNFNRTNKVGRGGFGTVYKVPAKLDHIYYIDARASHGSSLVCWRHREPSEAGERSR
jgi:hypothetical protein